MVGDKAFYNLQQLPLAFHLLLVFIAVIRLLHHRLHLIMVNEVSESECNASLQASGSCKCRTVRIFTPSEWHRAVQTEFFMPLRCRIFLCSQRKKERASIKPPPRRDRHRFVVETKCNCTLDVTTRTRRQLSPQIVARSHYNFKFLMKSFWHLIKTTSGRSFYRSSDRD